MADGDIQELYNLARKQAFFELKFDKITLTNIKLYQDLIKALNAKCQFSFKAIVIDRKQPSYQHESLPGMYKRTTHMYFDFCLKRQCVYIPDQIDPSFDWQQIINRPNKLITVIPLTSHSIIPIQVVDVLTGIVRLGLEIKYKEKRILGRNDSTKQSLVSLFEKEFKVEIKNVSNSAKSAKNYVGIWTIDFSKSKGSRHEH